MASQSQAEELRLLRAVISQMNGKLDNEKLARDIGAPNAAAAQKRWKRYRAKLLGPGGNSPGALLSGANNPNNARAPPVKAAAIRRAPTTPKNKANIGKAKAYGSGSGKKRKIQESDEESEVEVEEEDDDDDMGGVKLKEDDEAESEVELKPKTPPSRQLPGRKARSVASGYKESSSEDEDEDAGEGEEDHGPPGYAATEASGVDIFHDAYDGYDDEV